MSWTDERINTLTKMWGAGKSASEIAEKLGGVTRNAVIGKAHRLGLSGRPSPIKKVAAKKTTTAKKAAAPKTAAKAKAVKPKAVATPAKRPVAAAPIKMAPVIRQAASASGRPPEIIQLAALANASSQPDGSIISILELNERTCRWPVGDPKDSDFGYCGSVVYAAHPYCAEHVAIAFQAPNRKEKKPVKDLKDTEVDEEDLEDIEVEIEDDDGGSDDDTLTDDLDDDDTPVVVI